MLDYLKKFNNLPAGIRQLVSGQKTLALIEELEKKYQILLAALVMRVLVKEISLADLASALVKDGLAQTPAGQLAKELEEKIFSSFKDYLSDRAPAQAAPTGQIKASAKTDLPGSEPAKSINPLFSSDDEAEIKQLTEKIDSAENKDMPVATIEEKLKTIIDHAQINFGSADLAGRFKQILRIYLRGIRNKLDTKLTLTKPFSNGGLSFDEDSAQKVIDLTDKILNLEPGEAIKPFPKIKIPVPTRDTPYDFSQLAKEPKIPAPAGMPESGEIKIKPESDLKWKVPSPAKPIALEPTDHELAPLVPVLAEQPVKVKQPVSDKKVLPKLPEKEITPMPEPPVLKSEPGPFIRRRFEAENLNLGQKTRVEDVKYVPKVLSPLDELRYMDLISFRRLDKNPSLAAQKIKDKIDLLAEENYAKKLNGIRLWRSSPVNKLYLDIGQFSISKNKPVDVIIEERKMKGGEYLTTAEFASILELNKSLRF